MGKKASSEDLFTTFIRKLSVLLSVFASENSSFNVHIALGILPTRN
jgi:hypothetical protein